MQHENVIHEEDYKHYHIQIVLDTDLMESPREWENVGTMACWNRNYTLGDEQPKCSPVEHMRSLLSDNCDQSIEQSAQFIQWMKEEDHEEYGVYEFIDELPDSLVFEYFQENYFVLGIYAYQHGGITIRSSGFSDPFDSGQVGFIYVNRDNAMLEFKDDKDKIIACLESEIKTYDDYLTGNVFGYSVYKESDEEDHKYEDDDSIESVWGLYPEHEIGKKDYSYCLTEARSVVDYKIREDAQASWESFIKSECILGD